MAVLCNTPPPYPALRVSSIWLFLNCTLYNITVKVNIAVSMISVIRSSELSNWGRRGQGNTHICSQPGRSVGSLGTAFVADV